MTHVRKVIGFNDRTGRPELGDPYVCCWSDCPRYGHEEHKVVADNGRNEHTGQPQTLTYIFCCEKHKIFYVWSHRDSGNLPSGYKTSQGLLRY